MTYTFKGYVDIHDVRVELARVVGAAITSLPTYPYMPDAIMTTSFVIGEVDIQAHQTHAGADRFLLKSYVFSQRTGDPRASQAALSAYILRGGPKSVRTAIESQRRAGATEALSGMLGPRGDLVVESVEGYREYQVGSQDHRLYGARFDVRLYE